MELVGKSKDELVKLAADVETALAKLEEKKLRDALDALKTTAQEHGFTLDYLIEVIQSRPAGKGRGKGKAKNPPKYRNPANPTETWTGRGRKPGWIKDAETAGVDLAEYAI